MRALHVFPTFDDRLLDGSRRYAFHLSRELAALGVIVEVLTTTAAEVRSGSSLSLRWEDDYPAAETHFGDVSVHRFSTTWSMPRIAGRAISAAMRWRWRRERKDGNGDAPPVDVSFRRAMTRPRLYDRLAALARGPHSLALDRAAATKGREADVILGGFAPFATLDCARRAADLAAKPFIALPLFHPHDPCHHFRDLYRLFGRAEATLVQTRFTAEVLQRHVPSAHPVEVGVGVDPAELGDERIAGERFRSRHGLRNDRVILFVGRKEAAKRYDVAIEALERLADPQTRLVMIGADVDGQPIRSARVVRLGWRERAELLDAYDACDVLIHPSMHESFGTVLLEAWMRGKPVVGNRRCGPVASLITDGVDGFLCDGADDFAAHLRQLVDDPGRAAALGRAGRDKALARYTWPAVARRVLSVYESFAGRRANLASWHG